MKAMTFIEPPHLGHAIGSTGLTLIGNMGSDPGDELRIIHRHLGGVVLAGAIADLALGPQKGQPLQRQKRRDHVFPDPFGLRLGLRPHAAMDRESRMPPGEQSLRPLRAEEFLADEKSQDLVGEKSGKTAVIERSNLIEDARLIHSALGHQEVQVRMTIDPVPKCLDGRDDSGSKLAPGYKREITGQGPEGQATELPEELAVVLESSLRALGDP
jgi:hypothetical protein